MATVLFDSGIHKCIVFDDILTGDKDPDIQANQFLIIHNGEGLLYDPGGVKVFDSLYKRVSEFIKPSGIKTIVLSHQDPDAGAAISLWISACYGKIMMPSLWLRFVPHFVRTEKLLDYYIPIPEKGMRYNLNDSEIIMLPAHFLHSPGNIQIYDSVSKILFSGDLGTSIIPGAKGFLEVTDFNEHIKFMEGFHKRYMVSQKVCKLWANMVRKLDIEAIVPQHGHRYFKGKTMVNRFIEWISNLQCGVDLLGQDIYNIP